MSIKIGELRYNNRVLNPNNFEMFIVGIYNDEILLNFEGNEGGVWEYEIIDLQPIKLSKEVLEMCIFNFEKLGFNYSVSHGITSDKFHFVLNDNYYIKIEYLHELQNIYFDFCKTELNFKNIS
jgi:hypothetical protein